MGSGIDLRPEWVQDGSRPGILPGFLEGICCRGVVHILDDCVSVWGDDEGDEEETSSGSVPMADHREHPVGRDAPSSDVRGDGEAVRGHLHLVHRQRQVSGGDELRLGQRGFARAGREIRPPPNL